ncbi:hypothetical protein C8R44DRAFT_744829 [Mycena epipterygia]|nr:hypothetical protein C8R44DRAFT_744829 [Mycena epipterygia]
MITANHCGPGSSSPTPPTPTVTHIPSSVIRKRDNSGPRPLNSRMILSPFGHRLQWCPDVIWTLNSFFVRLQSFSFTISDSCTNQTTIIHGSKYTVLHVIGSWTRHLARYPKFAPRTSIAFGPPGVLQAFVWLTFLELRELIKSVQRPLGVSHGLSPWSPLTATALSRPTAVKNVSHETKYRKYDTKINPASILIQIERQVSRNKKMQGASEGTRRGTRNKDGENGEREGNKEGREEEYDEREGAREAISSHI